MSTVLRLWLLLLFLVHHATSAPSLFGCIKGAFCLAPKPPKPPKELSPREKLYQEFSSHPEEFETVGFIPSKYKFHFRYLDFTRVRISTFPLGPGTYLVGERSTAYKMAKETDKDIPGHTAICSVHVRKDFFNENWRMVYVPASIWVDRYDSRTKFELLRFPENLKVYLKALETGHKEHGDVLVSHWNYDTMSARGGFSYIMKISEFLLAHSVVACDKYLSAPENLDLQWEQKFRGEWKLSNFLNPMDILTEDMETGKKTLKSSRKKTMEQGTQTEGDTMGAEVARWEKQSLLDVAE